MSGLGLKWTWLILGGRVGSRCFGCGGLGGEVDCGAGWCGGGEVLAGEGVRKGEGGGIGSSDMVLGYDVWGKWGLMIYER